MTTPTTPIQKVAVIGGGITGAVVATELAKNEHIKVILFDQGRRGPGGRASHRSVDPGTSQVVLQDDDPAQIASGKCYEFDHGCQFFRADSLAMQTLVQEWTRLGFCAPWSARWGRTSTASHNFFGLPDRHEEPVFCGVGGMHQIPRQLLALSNVEVHRGTRISQVTRRRDELGWDLGGTCGTAAFHDSPENKARATTAQIVDTVDAVVVTDASASQDTWHRASAGLPPDFGQELAHRPRVPFFTCMVALKEPIRTHLQLDAFVGDSPLWCAICSHSKPGFSSKGVECWTLVSTPDFAVQQIQETPMRDRTTGAFKPQEDDYLNKVPGPMLFQAFERAVQSLVPSGVSVEPVYLQAQRWGSGLPAPHGATSIVNVDGLDYVDQVEHLVYPKTDTNSPDFVADNERRLFYAGDFCSHRNPGFEAAALSGLDLARHLTQLVESGSSAKNT